MGAVEDAVDAAIEFVGPYLDRGSKGSQTDLTVEQAGLGAEQVVDRALSHLQTINIADQTKDADAPYDGSLVGVVYGLIDLITSLGILPFLSSGVAFNQRPQTVLIPSFSLPPPQNKDLLPKVIQICIPIFEQERSGVQPLLTQRALPDIISAVAELAFSPRTSERNHVTFQPQYKTIIASTATSRLLPILTSFLQQDIPPWLRQRLAKELAMVPLRPHGVRHTVEFLSLSYLSKNSQMPPEAGGSLSQIPIPLEAITQTSRLLASVPSGMNVDDWVIRLTPQLLALLDGVEGPELSTAAAQIITSGILNRKATGAPGTKGWDLFAKPIIQAFRPEKSTNTTLRQSTGDQVIVNELALKLALKRLSALTSSYIHKSVLKRVVGPVLLPLWGLMVYANSRPSLDKQWIELTRGILTRYMSQACDPKQVDILSTNLFWNGDTDWTFGPGHLGGVEIRRRKQSNNDAGGVGGMLSRIAKLDEQVNLVLALLKDADIDDDTAGAIFVHATQRWLSTGRPSEASKPALINDGDVDPLIAFVDAKITEAMANEFKDKFARSPQHIIELMGQLLQNFVDDRKTQASKNANSNNPSRANLGNIVNRPVASQSKSATADTTSEDLVSFALSILQVLVTSSDFKPKNSPTELFASILPSLKYLSQAHSNLQIPPLITNASINLLATLQPSTPASATQSDPLAQHRITLQSVLKDLTSPDPPNRTWALSTLHNLLLDPTAFPLIDIPSTAHLLLSASIADPESYVHTTAIPVLVDLATIAPNPTLRILVDSFVDIEETSLRMKKEADIEQALDFRLRVGEVLNNLVMSDKFWANGATKFLSLKMIVEAVLSVASRRGQRKKTLSKRTELLEIERREQEEGEAAWGGPIPNLLDADREDPVEQAERDALINIVQGWQETGLEEDVRIRSSALSVLSVIMEKRVDLMNQVTVDASLQMVLQILVVESGDSKALLRRAAVLVIMGLLRGTDVLLEDGKESPASLGLKQTSQAERVVKWLASEDSDGLVRRHAEDVIEALETWRMKKLFRAGKEQFKLSTDLGLESNLRGLDVNPAIAEEGKAKKRLVVEEIE